MTIKNSNTNFGSLARFLHWAVALLVLALYSTGISLNIIKAGFRTTLLKAHISIGLLVFVFVILAIVWGFRDNKPNPPSMLKSLRLLTYKAIHLVLYPGILILTISGIGILISSGMVWPLTEVSSDMIARNLPPIKIHSVMFKFQLLLIILHVGGVLSYQLFKEDILHRMGIGKD